MSSDLKAKYKKKKGKLNRSLRPPKAAEDGEARQAPAAAEDSNADKATKKTDLRAKYKNRKANKAEGLRSLGKTSGGAARGSGRALSQPRRSATDAKFGPRNRKLPWESAAQAGQPSKKKGNDALVGAKERVLRIMEKDSAIESVLFAFLNLSEKNPSCVEASAPHHPTLHLRTRAFASPVAQVLHRLL